MLIFWLCNFNVLHIDMPSYIASPRQDMLLTIISNGPFFAKNSWSYHGFTWKKTPSVDKTYNFNDGPSLSRSCNATIVKQEIRTPQHWHVVSRARECTNKKVSAYKFRHSNDNGKTVPGEAVSILKQSSVLQKGRAWDFIFMVLRICSRSRQQFPRFTNNRCIWSRPTSCDDGSLWQTCGLAFGRPWGTDRFC